MTFAQSSKPEHQQNAVALFGLTLNSEIEEIASVVIDMFSSAKHLKLITDLLFNTLTMAPEELRYTHILAASGCFLAYFDGKKFNKAKERFPALIASASLEALRSGRKNNVATALDALVNLAGSFVLL